MGQVLLKISVSEDGAVRTADVLKGDPVLAVAAVDAVKHWEFAPFVRNGKAVKASTTVPLWFAIADGKCTHDIRQATVTTPFDNVVTVSESDMKPFVCKKTPAALTGLAQLARVSGDVVLHVNIGKDGMVTNILVVRSASPMLTGSAIDAVRQWRYRPYLVSNEPTVVDTEITVSF